MRAAGLLLCTVVLLVPTACAGGDRVKPAEARHGVELRRLLAARGLPYPPREIFIRAFKRERVFEVWAREKQEGFQLLLSFPFCAASGELGPKRQSGDGQVPEGFYTVNRFNPWSSFHLSLGLDYPNLADRRRGQGQNLGGDIFLHGGCASIGCIAITDQRIEPVYLLADGARRRGQRQLPVHIFPARLDQAGLSWLRQRYAGQGELLAFWETLRPGYLHFESHRTLPRLRVDARGRYLIEARQLAAR